jgi:hypothetical protein
VRDDKHNQFVDESLGCLRGGSRTAPTNHQRGQFVDDLLEAVLKRYGGEEPRSGLETRILAGLRTRERAARRRGLVWAVAACAGTLAAFVLTLHFVRTPVRHIEPGAPLPPTSAKTPARLGSADSRFRSPRLVRGPKEKPRTPKAGVRATQRPEQFPTPYPLTEQEKLLLAYLDKATKSDSVAGTNEHGVDEAPVSLLVIPGIEIAALEIKPLDDSQSEQQK